MPGETAPAVRARKDRPPRTRAVKLNGHQSPTGAPHFDPRVDMRRPYILESGSFYKRMQADLNYADTELEMIHVNPRALAERENDLMIIRDTALHALGQMQERMQALGTERPAVDQESE